MTTAALENLSPAVPLSPDVDLQTLLDAWTTATERLQRTHLALRTEVRRLSDELERKNRELARKNRLADLGQMAAHVAHEVRNNLLPMTLYTSLLRRRLDQDPDSVSLMKKIESGLTALESTVTDLLQFTADRDPSWTCIAVRPLIDEVLESLAPQLSAQRISAELDVESGLEVHADRDMLRRALLNLVLNAVDVMPEGGAIHFTALHTPGRVEIEVADDGPGLSEDAQCKVFEPFFTTKEGGTGLGLAIVYRMAEAHGGDVTAANCPQGGAAFTIRLPKRTMEAAA